MELEMSTARTSARSTAAFSAAAAGPRTPIDASSKTRIGAKPLVLLTRCAPSFGCCVGGEHTAHPRQPRNKVAVVQGKEVIDPVMLVSFRSASAMLAPTRLAPVRLQRKIRVCARFAPARSAPLRSEVAKTMPERLAFEKFAPARFDHQISVAMNRSSRRLSILALLKSAPLKSAWMKVAT